VDYDPVNWENFGAMKQDVAGYFVKMDKFGKSDMDYFVEEKMHFGKDEELPIGPVPVKTAKSAKSGNASTAKRWAPTKPKATIKSSQSTSSNLVKLTTRRLDKSSRANLPPTKRAEKFMRENMVDEVALLEREELALCKNDDFGMSFDLEL
jgi:hypothetical protein